MIYYWINKLKIKYESHFGPIIKPIVLVLTFTYHVLIILLILFTLYKLRKVDEMLVNQNFCLYNDRPDIAIDVAKLDVNTTKSIRQLDKKISDLQNRIEDINDITSNEITTIINNIQTNSDLIQNKILNLKCQQ